jgi:AcrR family transcriptional regulator
MPQADTTSGSPTTSSTTKRKLPKQRANESRMIDAAVTLLEEHPVSEVTNAAVASVSRTQPSYVTRYFGSRDEFLLAVAEELARRIADRNLGLRVLLASPEGNSRFTGIFAIPEVESWFKLWRYLVGTDLLDRSPRQGDGPLLTAGIDNLQAQLGFPPEEARTWALVTLISVLGFRVSGGVLGITPEESGAVADKVIDALLRDAEHYRNDSPAPEA